MLASSEETYRKADAVDRKKHAIRKALYAHLDFTMRLTPERAWNAYVRGNLRISVRFFARLYGIPESTWRQALGRGTGDSELKTATTDNGCEVSHQKAIKRILGRSVLYTRAYASYGKDGVKTIVNSIHRCSLKGEPAYDCHSRLAKTF